MIKIVRRVWCVLHGGHTFIVLWPYSTVICKYCRHMEAL